LDQKLIEFYSSFLQFVRQSEPKAVRERMVSLYPTDKELTSIFGEHSRLGRQARARETQRLMEAPMEALAEHLEEDKRMGKLVGLERVDSSSLIMTQALKNQGYIKKTIYTGSVAAEFEHGFKGSGEFAFVMGRWVTLPNISFDVRAQNIQKLR
jgi:hypothetical protein